MYRPVTISTTIVAAETQWVTRNGQRHKNTHR